MTPPSDEQVFCEHLKHVDALWFLGLGKQEMERDLEFTEEARVKAANEFSAIYRVVYESTNAKMKSAELGNTSDIPRLTRSIIFRQTKAFA